MKVLVLNCGSSSIKYQFIDTETKTALAKGMVERIGMTGAVLSHTRYDGDRIKIVGEILDHKMAVEYVLGVMLSKNHGVIDDKEDIEAVGHRVVHGGETFSGSVLITDDVVKVLDATGKDVILVGLKLKRFLKDEVYWKLRVWASNWKKVIWVSGVIYSPLKMKKSRTILQDTSPRRRLLN